jgi:hypothetical protein
MRHCWRNRRDIILGICESTALSIVCAMKLVWVRLAITQLTKRGFNNKKAAAKWYMGGQVTFSE